MSKKKKTSQLALALVLNMVLILGAVLVINAYIKRSINEVTVYKYATSLARDTQISENDIVEVKISADAVTENTVRDKSQIINKFTAKEVYAGELVDSRKIVVEGQVNPLSTLDQEEASKMRKVSLAVDMLSTWGGSLSKGDRVDLSYTGSLNGEASGESGGGTYTKIFMQNVLVYDVLSSAGESYIKPEDRPAITIDPNNEKSAELAEAEIERRSDVVMVILAVTPEQYEEIRNRTRTGEVDLVGRFENSVNVETKGYSDSEVINPSTQGIYKVEEKKTVLIEDKQGQASSSSGW